jgi:hypothetical protein
LRADEAGSSTPTILGADLSLSHSVFHHSSGRKFELDGELKRGKKLIHAHEVARLDFLASSFEREFATLSTEPGHLFLEGYAMGAKWGREAQGEWSGQVRRIVYRAGWHIVLVPPTVLKKYVTGSGAADKDAMRMHVLKRWGYESSDNDDADAFALLQLGVEYLGDRSGLTKERVQLLDKLKILMAEAETSGGDARADWRTGVA